MAATSIDGFIRFPEVPSSAFGLTGQTLGASGRKFAAIVQAPKTGTISKVRWQTGLVTTGATMTVRIETVDTSTGDPTGTLWGTTTSATQVVGNTQNHTEFTTTLTAGAAVTRGDVLAVVIVAGASANLDIEYGSINDLEETVPYLDYYNGSVWAKVEGKPALALEYSDGSYPNILGAVQFSAATGSTYTSNSNPNEFALKFQIPVDVSVAGLWMYGQILGDCTFRLYDADGNTVLASLLVRGPEHYKPGGSDGVGYWLFPASVDLARGQSYRLSVTPEVGGSGVSFWVFTYTDTNLMGALDGGSAFLYSTRHNGGSWTEQTTKRPPLGLILDGFTFSVASDLVSLWREYTAERDIVAVPDATVYQYLQAGAEALNRAVGYHYSTDSTSVVLVAGTQEYSLPSDCVEVQFVEWNGHLLEKSDIERWRSKNIDWRNTPSGFPREWAWYADKLVLHPKPSAAAVVAAASPVIRYVSTPRDLSVYGAEQATTQDQRLIVYEAVAIWSRAYPDSVVASARAEAFGQRFTEEAALVAKSYEARRLAS